MPPAGSARSPSPAIRCCSAGRSSSRKRTSTGSISREDAQRRHRRRRRRSGSGRRRAPTGSRTRCTASSILQLATVETRYRYVENSAGVTAANQWQHKQTFKGAFKFDEKGRYTLQALLGTGSSFTASWDTTGVGTGDPTWDFRVRRLWLRAVPVDGLELSAGSFDVVRGETTEIMSYDNDAYMQGYRASVKRPAQAFFDEISVTAGYLGDLTQPNVFERFKWMDNHNYTQALVAKRVGKMFAASVDWTSVDHVDTVREGVRIGTKDLDSRRHRRRARAGVSADGFTDGHGHVRGGGAVLLQARDGLRRLRARRPEQPAAQRRPVRPRSPHVRRRIDQPPARIDAGRVLHARVRRTTTRLRTTSGWTSC